MAPTAKQLINIFFISFFSSPVPLMIQ